MTLGRRKRRRDLACRVEEFATSIESDFATEANSDPRAFKRKVRRLLNKFLPPHAGRPANEEVSRAIAMRDGGYGWQKIYSCCIAPENRSNQAENALRSAVRSRKYSQRKHRRKHQYDESGIARSGLRAENKREAAPSFRRRAMGQFEI